MPHLTHPEDGMVFACPECDTAEVQRRHPLHPASQGDTPCWCRNCRAEFTTPISREKRANPATHRLGGKSKLEALLDEHPELREQHAPVGFETASSLRTDGGGRQP